MPLSNSVFGASAPLATPWLAKPKLRNDRHHLLHTKRIIPQLITYSVSRNGSSSSSLELDVPFPNDYQELLRQCLLPLTAKESKAIWLCRQQTRRLNCPTPGMNDLCQFFPEANEVKFARQTVFEGSSLKLDYLTKPSFFEDFGFVEKVRMKDRVKPEDELFLVAYPYFNVNEMLVVEELYKEAVVNTTRKLIIFNGELDRIRSGCILVMLVFLIC
ncbi:uncharacterized protein LOC105632674 [Jatropha curcas]|uniref:uncharacterized protein LOC105632674 n=1 Tax=Jatropha curcas TaxID=180498 RepID=UPI001893F390|nr:uncharacterized protein LOC105632674 [Jatropha curcas]